ncbi:MAG: putative PEP-binding protein [Altererythrobacter sp.]
MSVDYLVGTMIELPRAALMAGEIAEEGAFFSFGTNDLTQTTLGVSRDDSARFLAPVRRYFAAIRSSASMSMGLASWSRSRLSGVVATRPDTSLGIGGEHGGDPASIAFSRASRARLRQRRLTACLSQGWAAAQAALK